MPAPFLSNQDRALLRNAAKANDPDRYAAALFAPNEMHDPLIAITAVAGDIARIPLSVSDPVLAEIRLQWWRDALEALKQGNKTGNPLADNFSALLIQDRQFEQKFLTFVDARSAQVEAIALGDFGAVLEASIASETAIFSASIEAVKMTGEELDQSAITDAGQAYGAASFVRDLHKISERLRVRGQTLDKAASVLETAKSRAETSLIRLKSGKSWLSPPVLPVLLPVALVEPYFRLLQTSNDIALESPLELQPLRRLWCLWRMKRRGRI
jgi:15-cis-phytoene synthase